QAKQPCRPGGQGAIARPESVGDWVRVRVGIETLRHKLPRLAVDSIAVSDTTNVVEFVPNTRIERKGDFIRSGFSGGEQVYIETTTRNISNLSVWVGSGGSWSGVVGIGALPGIGRVHARISQKIVSVRVVGEGTLVVVIGRLREKQ